MLGRIHSFESCAMTDGPGIRNIIFFQGCKLRCKYCHNPDTWNLKDGKEIDSKDIANEVLKYKEFIKSGGVTISGGEPFMQKEFLLEILKEMKKNNIHTCVDTSGFIENIESVKEIVEYVDLFLVDFKAFDENKHMSLTGVSNSNIKRFLEYLNEINKPVWIRYVLVPNLTDDFEEVKKIREYLSNFSNIEKIQILPFHKYGEYKWEELNIDYELKNTKEPDNELINNIKREITP